MLSVSTVGLKAEARSLDLASEMTCAVAVRTQHRPIPLAAATA
jgi:hypothetical protein